MNSDPIPASPFATEPPDLISEQAKTVATHLKAKANQELAVYEDKVRKSPAKAILIAMGAGYCLNRLPLGPLIAAPLRLTAMLAKPALLALGVAKLYDIAVKQSLKP